MSSPSFRMSALPASDGRSRWVEGYLDLGLALILGAAALALACTVYLGVAAEAGAMSTWLAVLLAAAGVVGAAGAFTTRRTLRPPRPVGEPVATPRGEAIARGAPLSPQEELGLAPSLDEVGNLMDSFSRMLSTIERQAQEVDRYALRLDSAYKEIETSSAQLKEFSFKDEVTGLYNRRFFSIRLEEEVSRYRRFNHPVAVVLLDLDGFKAVNDTLGHPAGDEDLRRVAALIDESRLADDGFRIGGDEFAILMPKTCREDAALAVTRLCRSIGEIEIAGGEIGASFGLAEGLEDPAALHAAADSELLAAKDDLYGRPGIDRPS